MRVELREELRVTKKYGGLENAFAQALPEKVEEDR